MVEGQLENSFRTHLYGRLTDNGGQTRLRCFVGMNPLFAPSLILFLGYLFFFNSRATAAGLLFFFCVMVAFGIVGRVLARNEQKFLIDFLRKTIDIRDAE